MPERAPERCQLCDTASVRNAGFTQQYHQGDQAPVHLAWWECRACGGWFAYPPPNPATIARHWQGAQYNLPGVHENLFQHKTPLLQRLLHQLKAKNATGTLLDVGANYGDFLALAQQAGWKVCGFEPFAAGAEAARQRGFDVRTGWALEEASFAPGSFDAITMIDAFYYAWHPYALLQTFFRLLRPGGWLAMRLSNKRMAFGLVRRALTGKRRNRVLSRLLQGQLRWPLCLRSWRPKVSKPSNACGTLRRCRGRFSPCPPS